MRGHKTNQLDSAGSTVTGIEVTENGEIRAYADKRKAGGVAGFWYTHLKTVLPFWTILCFLFNFKKDLRHDIVIQSIIFAVFVIYVIKHPTGELRYVICWMIK